MDLSKYKMLIVRIITAVIGKCDAKATEYQATIAKISAEAAELRATNASLAAALEAKDAELAQALLDQSAAQSAALDVLTSELEAEYNPTPVADAVAVIVRDEPAIVTPPEVVQAVTLETSEATPEVVAEAAVDAIATAE
jgi:hypothetical protein